MTRNTLLGSIVLGAALRLAIVFGVAGCTTVQATLPDGTAVDVKTFAQSRQNIDVGRDKDGNVYWKASNSSPDQTLAQALADVVRIIAVAPAATD